VLADDFMIQWNGALFSIVTGALILFFGRKLFWLFVAAVGFAIGFQTATYLFREPSPWIVLLISLGVGILGALLAILFQKVAIALAGFVAGGRLAVALAAMFFARHGEYLGVIFLIGGILGAIFLLALFNWAIILLSAVEGGRLIVSGFVLAQPGCTIVFAALLLTGTVVQASMLRRSQPPLH